MLETRVCSPKECSILELLFSHGDSSRTRRRTRTRRSKKSVGQVGRAQNAERQTPNAERVWHIPLSVRTRTWEKGIDEDKSRRADRRCRPGRTEYGGCFQSSGIALQDNR